ncbi:MAG UNVERIFIED_CONTAM: imidazole glycerol phosphate synthase subunit HisH [Microcystis novacekii LVE1205-3]|jgi:glutamine amidotransferase
MTLIAVIDYDMGNLHSACKGLETVGAVPKLPILPSISKKLTLLSYPESVLLILLSEQIRSSSSRKTDSKQIANGKPFLGICLGLQILFDSSEEGQEAGLGIIPGTVRRFRSEPGITIPHMGWNQLDFTQPDHALWHGLPQHPHVYFVHSYYVDPLNSYLTAATVTHGSQTVTDADRS